MLPAAAIFDNDGLTLDTEQAWTRAEVALFARYGVTFTRDHKRLLLGTAREMAEARLESLLGLPGRGAALAAELHDLVMAEVGAGAPPKAGVPALLAELRRRGVPVALASNSRRDFVDRALRVSGLAAGFDAIVTVDDVAHPKPAPDVYLAAAAALGADPSDCAALEDSPTGVAAARAAGMLVIGVPSLPEVALLADVVASSVAEPAVWEALGLDAPAAATG